MRQLRNRQKEYWGLLPREDGTKNSSLAVFVHGFKGGYLDTWGQLPDLLARHADDTPPFDQWDYVFLGYNTSKVQTYLDIAWLISTQIRLAADGKYPYTGKYERFALFGHSLGTLGIRQLLCAWSLHVPNFLSALHGVVFFGTPLNGSPLASAAKMFWKIGAALEPENPQLRMLRSWSDGSYTGRPWKPATVVLGLDDKVVGSRLAELVDWPGDVRPVMMTNFDHRDLAKPDSWDNSIIIDQIRNALQ